MYLPTCGSSDGVYAYKFNVPGIGIAQTSQGSSITTWAQRGREMELGNPRPSSFCLHCHINKHAVDTEHH